MFGWDWDFEIMDEKIIHGEAVVKGKLTCRTNGRTIVKMQYGNKDIMTKRGSNEPLSIGNDLKAAATDALKKCAAEIGIAADIYNKMDFNEVNVHVPQSRDWKAELEAENSITGLNEIWRQMSENEQVRYKLLYTEKLNECGLS